MNNEYLTCYGHLTFVEPLIQSSDKHSTSSDRIKVCERALTRRSWILWKGDSSVVAIVVVVIIEKPKNNRRSTLAVSVASRASDIAADHGRTNLGHYTAEAGNDGRHPETNSTFLHHAARQIQTVALSVPSRIESRDCDAAMVTPAMMGVAKRTYTRSRLQELEEERERPPRPTMTGGCPWQY